MATTSGDRRRKQDPLKEEPLPQAGDSLHDEILELVLDKGVFWILAFAMFAAACISQWIAWLTRRPTNPTVMTIVTVVLGIVAVARTRWATRYTANLRLGARGERAVGQQLEALRAKGYRVYHDVCEPGFNVDHVLIGPGGVFVIETKTISKPADREAKITYDGQRVLVAGHEPDRDPIQQAKASADYIRNILERATGRSALPIRPVVLYPGWWVDTQPKGVEVWVLNPKALPFFLDHEPTTLKREDIALLSEAMETHVRASK